MDKGIPLYQGTATEEAMGRVQSCLKDGIKQYEALPWWNVKQRFLMKGALTTLKMMLELLHDLNHKYDNQDGRLN